MPVYRLHPGVPETEAIRLWWPWGREPPLRAGPPPREPASPRTLELDPAIITATRPAEVIREVMQKTGINRTTAALVTKDVRAKLRQEREQRALRLLLAGTPRAEVAATVGLSLSRLGELFKGRKFRRRDRFAKALELLTQRDNG
jgi:hypothetical protein